MALPAANAARARFAAQAMRKPLRAMRREIAGVRENQDIECVHRMRVASRRLRNALDLFGDELPAVARDRQQKRLKAVTKSLGAARDLDVQIAFLREYLHGLGASCQEDRPGIEHLLTKLAARREAAQAAVLKALDRLVSSRVLASLADWAEAQLGEDNERQPSGDELRAEASRAVRHRLGNLFAYEPYVERPEAIKELHAMRIAAKHLRYTLEAYAPLYSNELTTQIQWGRHLQDWLGEIHDCDVWEAELERLAGELAERTPRRGRQESAPARLKPGIEHLRQERSERRAAVYEEFRTAWRRAAETGYWNEFRQPFVGSQVGPARIQRRRPARAAPTLARAAGQDEGTPSEPIVQGEGTAEEIAGDERVQPALELARSCRYEAEHTHQVTRLALRLFERLAKLHGLDDEHRFWLTCAGLLHDIGWVEGRAGHHKTALRLILDSSLLPWDDRLRRIIGLIARYHRKALPRNNDEQLAGLCDEDRDAVRKLAAILRIADALDYSHARVVQDVACRVSSRRISIRCQVTHAADVECARAVEKGDLASQVFDREIIVTWHRP